MMYEAGLLLLVFVLVLAEWLERGWSRGLEPWAGGQCVVGRV